MLDKLSGRIGAVFLKCFQITETAVFVDEGVLIPLCTRFLPDNADTRDEFNVDLNSLTWILHLFVGFRDIFWIWQRRCHLTALTEKTVQSGDGSGIAALSELHPEHHDTGVGIPAAHIEDKLDLVRRVLVRMTVRPV